MVITGATSGIGKALAIEYSGPHTVLILIARNELALDEVKLQCVALGSEVHCYSTDLSFSGKALQLSNLISNKYTVDLIISNAGLTNCSEGGRTEEWADIENLLAVNLSGAIAITHSVIQDMQKRKKGQVVYVSSLAAYYGMPLTPAYSASKAGLKAYAEAMRGLLAKGSVSVTLVTPGFVKTNMSDKFPASKPFMITAESAAKIIKKGVKRKKRVVSFPLLLSLGMYCLPLLPAAVSDYILSRLKY